MSYAAPLKDMLFVVNELANLPAVHALPGCEDATPETVEASPTLRGVLRW